MAAAVPNRDIANIKRYYNTTEGRVDIAAIAEKLLPNINTMTQNKHPYYSVTLRPELHGLKGIGVVKVIFEVRTDPASLREKEVRRSWRLEAVKDMTFIHKAPDITNQAKGVMQTLSIATGTVVPDPDFVIRMGTIRKHLAALGFEINDVLERMLSLAEKEEAEASAAVDPANDGATTPVGHTPPAPAKPDRGKKAAAPKAAPAPKAPKKEMTDDLL